MELSCNTGTIDHRICGAGGVLILRGEIRLIPNCTSVDSCRETDLTMPLPGSFQTAVK